MIAIIIATVIDWLKSLASMRSKTKTNHSLSERFFLRLELQVISRNSGWFILLFAPVVIGRTLVLVLSTVT